MKKMLNYWILPLLFLATGYKGQGQPIQHPWEIAIGGGMNMQDIIHETSMFESEAWLFLPKSSTTIERRGYGDKLGFQGSAMLYYHPRKHFSLSSGAIVSKVEGHVKTTTTTILLYDPFPDVTTTTLEQFDKDYVLMDIPVLLRWHLNPDDDRLHFFLDLGLIGRFPIVDHSSSQLWTDGVFVSKERLPVHRSGYRIGIGARARQYALSFDWSRLSHGSKDCPSHMIALSVARYFQFGKN